MCLAMHHEEGSYVLTGGVGERLSMWSVVPGTVMLPCLLLLLYILVCILFVLN